MRPDLDALAPRVALLRGLAHQPGEPRIVSPRELETGLMLAERLPSPTGYEPAVPPYRVMRLLHELALDRLAVASETDTVWQRLAARPGLAAALGVGVVVLPAPRAAGLVAAGYRQVAAMPDGDAVLLRPPTPRFQLVGRAIRAADDEDAFRRVTGPGFDPTDAAVLTDAALGAFTPATAAGTVTVVGETPEQIDLTVATPAATLLVVRDAFFPGWEASVDGRPAAILPANWAFRALALEAGDHTVQMVYRPRPLRAGVAISLLATLAAVGLWRLGTSARRDRPANRAGRGPFNGASGRPPGPAAPALPH